MSTKTVQIDVNVYDLFIISDNLKALEELLQELDNFNINLQICRQ